MDEVDDSVAAKRDQVLERLNRRNKDRQNYLDVKLEQRSKETSQLEGSDFFSHTFADRAHDIELRLQSINESDVKKPSLSGGDAPTTDLACFFAEILGEIQELQRYLTSSTIFLTDYKIKASQAVLHELTLACEETRTRLLPKKKFGFSGRKVAPKVLINPKISGLDKVDDVEKDKLKKDKKAFIWTLANQNDAYIRLAGTKVNNQDITISNLNNCYVELQGHAGSVQLSNVRNCYILCGPIARSLFAENCVHTSFAVACQQLRLHSSKNCKLFVHVSCRAIIEDCNSIEVDAYNYDYEGIEDDFKDACLDKEQNNYKDIADFNWLSPDVPSPNWHLVTSNDLMPKPNWTDLRMKFQMSQENCNNEESAAATESSLPIT